ncbi:Fe2+-enterobactin ABC transporter substrate-binding protein [Salmonella enterica subsp. enterica]|uniref:Fe2+-enterobactin ABC transporter substrate-binding protein n=2 Tax=Salmonella enterica TaxID=28901 RepID=A0A744K8V1_SALER|nr:Fe2+-enterobactin ABC transporter substrate-binding protein [Salmonella enterica subsp. enterica serovar Aqua]ECH1172066.1 Fe2+-enterobactin ABC transporter substrate-binding protein [Salmonella enterica subsp. enterica serovar Aqua]HAF2606130.1 Fe2+-enterobactin ABC transporter substrate-binding protein [Salmonella enterica]
MKFCQEKLYRFVVNMLLLLGLVVVSNQCVAQGWPRTFHNADGSVTSVPRQPERILSTAVSVTGTLLAIDAPVVASATAVNGHFFGQWLDVAKAKKIVKMWSAGSVDLEQAWSVTPDLIIVSINGADSAMAQLVDLQEIAPVIIVNYGNQTWQDLAHQLGDVLGLEKETSARIEGFNALVTRTRKLIHLPKGKSNIINFNGPGAINPVATPESVHARLLQSLGFSIEAPNPAWQSSLTRSGDFIAVEYENLTQLKAETTFLLSAGDVRINEFINDPLLQHLPSVQKHQVYSLGPHAFRVDYFSASEMIKEILRHFSGDTPSPDVVHEEH